MAGTVFLQPDMIPAAPTPLQQGEQQRWQALWRDAVRDPRQLLAMLGLDTLADGLSDAATQQFPLRVPRGFVARMRPGDARDPLLRQVLPVLDEDQVVPGFALDAVGDTAARSGHGVIQKYNGRALLIATGSCAVNCRYCFRRHYPYAEDTAAAGGWREAVALIAADATVHEVILSGGDPLSLADHKLAELTDALRGIPHIRRLRIHTRLPIVLPERVDAGLLAVRALAVVILIAAAGGVALLTTKGKATVAFAREARTEVRKVIWPTRQETLHTTLIVAAVTAVMSLILWGLDGILVRLVSFITGLRF